MSLLRRFWVYQAERFPLIATGVLMAVLSAGGLGFAHAARPAAGWPHAQAYLVAFVVVLGIFFQLRVADEFKDLADDRAHRPYRPVPRGLITLRELAGLALAAAVLQVALVAWLEPWLLIALALVWGYMALMRWEFGVGEWLRGHAVVYLLSHMVVLPLIFVLITACDWLPAGAGPPAGLGWLLAAAYANGIVFEIGRKIRAPDAEEPGVETYSFLWGRRRAIQVWLAALAAAAICAVLAAQVTGAAAPLAWTAAAGLLGAAVVAARFLRAPTPAHMAWIEQMSALWLLLIYGGLALLPWWAG